MKSENAVQTIAEICPNGILVPTMSAIRWVDQYGVDIPKICCVPLMGGASALGLGIALAQPSYPVIVLDGDGSLQMQLGSLISIVENAPPNLVHIVFNNGVWFEDLANIPVSAARIVDYKGLARSAGFSNTYRFSSQQRFAEELPGVMQMPGPSFIELSIEPNSDNLWCRDNPQPDAGAFRFKRMGLEARKLEQLFSSID